MSTGPGNPNEPNAEHNTTEGQGQAVDTPAPAVQASATDTHAPTAAPATAPAAPSAPAAAAPAGPAPAAPAAPAAAAPAAPAPAAAAAPTDDPPPDQVFADVTANLASSEALKPVATATEELYSGDPAKQAARDALQAAYAKAAGAAQGGKPEGDLHAKYAKADDKFQRAATDMKDRLAAWIAKRMAADANSFTPLLDDMAQVQKRLDQRAGPREAGQALAAGAAKAWQQAYANWSKPAETMTAMVADYFDKIDQLNAASNTGPDADYAIYSFWFEVAPKHLQLRPDPVTEANAPGVTTIIAALAQYPDLAKALQSGKDRGDGSLFLIDPVKLADYRKAVLENWRQAAVAQGQADAAFKLRPDDAASLKTRRDQLAQGFAASVKARLQDPPAN